MPQSGTEEKARLQAMMDEAKNKAAKKLKFMPRYTSPAKYLPGSRGVAGGALLAKTTPLNEDETRDLLSEIKRQGGFTDEEMESCAGTKLRLEYCTGISGKVVQQFLRLKHAVPNEELQREGQRKAQETKLKGKALNCTPPYYTHQKGTRMPEYVINQSTVGWAYGCQARDALEMLVKILQDKDGGQEGTFETLAETRNM